MEFEFDCSLVSEDRQRLMDAKNSRKQAEEDARLLANRIALLKQEEAKTLKKIENTKGKAQEVLEQRIRGVQRRKSRAAQHRIRESEIAEQRKFNQMQKEEHEINKENSKAERKDTVKRESNAVRKSSRHNQILILQQKNENFQHKTSVTQQIKYQRSLANHKKVLIEAEKREQAKAYLEEKLERELTIREDKERQIAELEAIELELIERLKNTQMMQKNAFEELENATYGDIDIENIY